MDEQILIYAAILVAVIVLTIVGILSRYRKCKSDEVLVVYMTIIKITDPTRRNPR